MNPAAEPPERVQLLFFVAKQAPRTARAIANLELALAEIHQPAFSVEIIDVSAEPERALSLRVLVTPTLLAPGFTGRLVGDLSEKSRLHYFLQSLTRF